jgi:DNA-binding transcriptional LysR family regulator
LYAYCLKSSFAIERLHSELDELRSLQRGRVRLAAMESAVPSVVCNAIDSFKKMYPNIIFYVDILTSDKILDAIKDGDVDLGLTFGEGFSEDIQVVYTAREPLLASMRPDHPLANRSSVTIQELANWPMALAPPKSSSRVIFDSGCAKAGVVVKPALQTNSIELMHRFAVLGTGITMLLRHAGMSSFTKNDLVAVPVEGDNFVGDVSIITLSQRTLPLAAERFLLAIQEELSRLPFPAVPTDAVRASATTN